MIIHKHVFAFAPEQQNDTTSRISVLQMLSIVLYGLLCSIFEYVFIAVVFALTLTTTVVILVLIVATSIAYEENIEISLRLNC